MSSLLHISEGASLALHGLAVVAKKSPDLVTTKELATALDASEAHLAKVFQKLHRAGIVGSVRGPAGGFSLARPAEEVSFMDIYRVIDGDVSPVACPLGKSKCIFRACIFQEKVSGIMRELHASLEGIRLSEFIQPSVEKAG